MSKVAPDEWLKMPTETDWMETPVEGSAEGRGMGALDMARAVRVGGTPPAGAHLAIHVLDIMGVHRRIGSYRTDYPPVNKLPSDGTAAHELGPASEIK